MQIPFKKLQKDVLFELLKEIVTRDGTDYGATERATEEKISEALSALETGRACLYWDADTETASLQPASE